MIKKILFIVLLFTTSFIYSFGNKEDLIDAQQNIVAGLILDSSGLGDQSVNDSCYLGLQKASEEGLITLRVRNVSDEFKFDNIIEDFISQGVSIIYTIGDNNKKIFIKAAANNPDIKFIGIDTLFSSSELKPNLYGITYKEQHGGYLAGIVAGSMTYRFFSRHEYLNKANKVGIIMGKATPSIKRYELGFFAGVKSVNQSCDIVSVNINSMSNEEKGYNAVKDLKKKGVDIVFSVAGDSDKGVFKAAEEESLFVIGSNKDMNSQSENVLTSVVKELSVSIYLITKEIITNEYDSGQNVTHGLEEGAISLANYYKYDRIISKELRNIIKDNTDKLSKGADIIPESINDVVFDSENTPELEEEI